MEKIPFIIGNWKMYKTIPEAQEYIEKFSKLIHGVKVRVGLSIPFTALSAAKGSVKNGEIQIGAQDVSRHDEGAYTGEICSLQLKDAGASFVLIGHSERRQYHHESHSVLKEKLHQALKRGIQPVVCIGETLEEREKGLTEVVLKSQIDEVLRGLPKSEAPQLALAYEPIWAIGAGLAATVEIAQSTHAFCRNCLKALFDDHVARSISILYGGSVKAENIAALMKEKDIDGALVGRASLDANEFAKIIHLSGNKKL